MRTDPSSAHLERAERGCFSKIPTRDAHHSHACMMELHLEQLFLVKSGFWVLSGDQAEHGRALDVAVKNGRES